MRSTKSTGQPSPDIMIDRSAGNSARGVVPCSSISCVSPFNALGITYMWSIPSRCITSSRFSKPRWPIR